MHSPEGWLTPPQHNFKKKGGNRKQKEKEKKF